MSNLKKYLTEDARARYMSRKKEISKLLKDLQRKIKKHEEMFRNGGQTNWAMVGDITYIYDKLKEMDNFLQVK